MKSFLAICFFVGVLSSSIAQAGFIEASASGTYKRSNIDLNAYDEAKSLTGSLAYYFDEMSALEASYTDGSSKRVVTSTNPTVTPNRKTSMFYQMLGLDFILTLGERDAVLRPYFKMGFAYIIKKKLVDEIQGFATDVRVEEGIVVPSAGLGVRILLTKNLSLKLGFDAWTSRSLNDKPVQYDYAGRAGLSWMF